MPLNKTSLVRLNGVHPAMVTRVLKVAETMPLLVIEGLRSEQRQKDLYAQGRTKPGPVVTWTLNSKHKAQADGYGHAVDLGPDPLDWNDLKKFDAIARAMFEADRAINDGWSIRWGADWDQDGKPRERGESDSPHFELIADPAKVVTRPTLRKGDKGEHVLALQKALWSEGYDCGQPDGDFGPATERALIAFQRSRGLGADGVAGPRTWAALTAKG